MRRRYPSAPLHEAPGLGGECFSMRRIECGTSVAPMRNRLSHKGEFRMTRCASLFAVGFLFFASVDSASAQVPAKYRIEDLGSFGGQALVGIAINATPYVAGVGALPDGTYHTFRWTRAGGLEDLGA